MFDGKERKERRNGCLLKFFAPFALRRSGESAMTAIEPQIPTPAELYAELERIAENARTFNRLMTTKAKIGQTPKETIWTLNKTKLYHYTPVVPA